MKIRRITKVCTIGLLLASIFVLGGCLDQNSTDPAPTQSSSDAPRYELVELSHRISDGSYSYNGMPPVKIWPYVSREQAIKEWGEGAQALLDQIQMVNISGTYIDSPLHRKDNADSIADIPLEKLVDLPTLVVDLPKDRNYFDVEDFKNFPDDIKGYAVLLRSGADKLINTDAYATNNPYLSVEGAKWLMSKGVVFVGIDSILIDDKDRGGTLGNPVHDIILDAKSIVCEDMTGLDQLPTSGALTTAVPPPVEMASFPARVFAKVPVE